MPQLVSVVIGSVDIPMALVVNNQELINIFIEAPVLAAIRRVKALKKQSKDLRF